jgi:hypothetical protein
MTSSDVPADDANASACVTFGGVNLAYRNYRHLVRVLVREGEMAFAPHHPCA